ncbi:MAG: hypothetical protein WC551_13350 [Patescibacteria group bacterium]
MKPIITIYLTLILVAALTELVPALAGPPAQVSTSGISLNVQKEKTPGKAYSEQKWQLKIDIANMVNVTNTIEINVYFLTGDKRVFPDTSRTIKKQFSLKPAERQTIKTDPNGNPAYQNYIVRVTSEGTLLKVVASNKDLEALANDPERMKQIETGGCWVKVKD